MNAWDKNDPRNADLIRHDVCDLRPIFANEFDKIYIRRNAYVRKISFENDLEKLKNGSYLEGRGSHSGIWADNYPGRIINFWDFGQNYCRRESKLPKSDFH